jgi:hypothetical protein
MPELSELQSLPPVSAPDGDDLLAATDVSRSGPGAGPVNGPIRVNQIAGLSPADVTAAVAGTRTATRLTLITSGTTSTVNFPAPSGALREVTVMNSGSGNATSTISPAAFRAVGATTAATTNVVATNTVAKYLSDGTHWFRVQ